jgi:hypothetical protein
VTANKRRKLERRLSKPRRNGRVTVHNEVNDDRRHARSDKRERIKPERPKLAIDPHRANRVGRRVRHFKPAVGLRIAEQSTSGPRVDDGSPHIYLKRFDDPGPPLQAAKTLQHKLASRPRGRHETGTGVKGISSKRRPPTPRLPRPRLESGEGHSPEFPRFTELDGRTERTCSSLRPELLVSLDGSQVEANVQRKSILGSIGLGQSAINDILNHDKGSFDGSTGGDSSMHHSDASGLTGQSDRTGSTRTSELSDRTDTIGHSSVFTLSEVPGLSTLVSIDNPDSTQMTSSVVTTLSSARTWDMSQLSSRGTAMDGPMGDTIDRPSSMVATTTNSADDIDLAEDMRLMNGF